MTYSIGQVSKMFGLPVSTLRYYDKEGFFPDLPRNSGIRRFTQKEVETLRVVECLKKSGMEIRDIKQFLDWCAQGQSTYSLRLDMFKKRKAVVEEEISRLNSVLDMINYKCWYYENALRDGDENTVANMPAGEMPAEIRKAYLSAFAPLQ